jgi:hypothetical protein
VNYDEANKALQLDQSFASVGTSDTKLVGPNTKRRALLIGAPIPTDTPVVNDSTLTSGADTSTTGVKSSYTVPAGVQATLLSATMNETTGTTVVAQLQIHRGATVIALQIFTKVGVYSAPADLQAGDIIEWNVTTAVALSVTDFTIFASRERVPPRVTLSFVGAPTAEQGLTLSPGTLPLYLHDDHIGSAIQREVRAIANAGTVTVPVVDIFDA